MTALSSEPLQILIVDDEEIVRNLLKRALHADRLTVEAAGSIKEALAMLVEPFPHLLIVDKNLPDGSGLEIVEAARAMGFDGEVIVITGYSDTDSAIQAVNLGVFRYVRKPFDLEALKVDIRRALETGRLRRDLAHRSLELERTNTELRDALSRIQESELRRAQSERLASIGSLAAGIAHEINNPLSLLAMTIPFALSELEGLCRKKMVESDPEKACRQLDKIHQTLKPTQEALDLLLGLSTDLHSLGKQDPPLPQPVRIMDAVTSALRIVRHQLKHKTRIEVEVPEDLTINGQMNRMVQIFINLLTNAGRAISPGKPDENRINIRGYLDAAHVVVEVADTGSGIPKENLERIFNRFFTFSVTGNSEGSGIGLSIVQELVTDHEGTIEVVSEVGVGTTFYLRFPISVSRKSYPPISTIFKSESQQFIRARRTILFVDSDADNLAAYSKSFGQMHTVYTALNIDDANRIIDEHADVIDVVVCHLGGNADIRRLYDTTVHRFSELKDHFIHIGESGPLLDEVKAAGLNVLAVPVRPAVLLAAIYRVPPRRPSNEI